MIADQFLPFTQVVVDVIMLEKDFSSKEEVGNNKSKLDDSDIIMMINRSIINHDTYSTIQL